MKQCELKVHPGVCAEKKDYEEAILWTNKFLTDYPDLDVALYNKSCFLAQLNRNDEALLFLKQAVDSGFRDKKYIQSDSDLKNLRDLDEFKEIVGMLPDLKTVQ